MRWKIVTGFRLRSSPSLRKGVAHQLWLPRETGLELLALSPRPLHDIAVVGWSTASRVGFWGYPLKAGKLPRRQPIIFHGLISELSEAHFDALSGRKKSRRKTRSEQESVATSRLHRKWTTASPTRLGRMMQKVSDQIIHACLVFLSCGPSEPPLFT